MGASISLDFITHKFSATAEPTLKDIENRIEPGELVALIGRSGCGKSTLLHMMAGLLIPTEGCVRINSHQVAKPSAKWNMMFQKASLYPWMSVKENAALGLIFDGVSKGEAGQRVDALLDMVGLNDKKNANVQSLSGGQQQRVALARSLATEPEVLLLDEPFSALDAFTRTQLQEEVPNICRERGLTMVIVTHDIDEAIAMADRVLIMSQNPGRIVGELVVDLPWPRRHMDAGFQAMRDELMKQFKGTDTGLAGRHTSVADESEKTASAA
ncbi:ABC transporter ATP-binding protein [Amphritea opalescens]|uniref:ABC transporter ATP-binding protein n=1 Tax=Amphritea opalescens TaxID=2490544 RepID=A0A430KSL1_9GAMM|nr:ABC transporter ATP-binding protein [Amphritea opalescens]RTE66489.1 ABC transporter ATP-binding protein [Amphritea opalescens]